MTITQPRPAPAPSIFEGRYTYNEIKVGSKTGESLLAFDNLTTQEVVIKRPSFLQPNPDVRRASIADLAREERALSVPAIANHPAVCRLLDAAETSGREGTYRYLVLTHATGTPVPALIHHYHELGQPLPPRIYLGILRQLLDLLTVAHQAGIVYNDVKAEHLFWDEKPETLKVIDWGNVQFIGETSSVSPTSDVFQCGELFYELLTGTRIASVASDESDLTSHPKWEVPFYQSVNPDLQRLVSKALHPDSEQRYQNAGEFAADLERYCLQSEPSLAESVSAASPAQRTKSPEPSSNSIESPEFNVVCKQLMQSIGAGETDFETLRSLEVTMLETALTEREWEQAEYLKDISETYIALASGQITAAADRLKQVSSSPLRNLHWDALNGLVQLVQAVAEGSQSQAQQALQALNAIPETSGAKIGRLWLESIQAFSDLQMALESFQTRPDSAWPTLETLPPIFRTRVIEDVLACSRTVQNGIDLWRDGKFLDAANVFDQSIVGIEKLPVYLGVRLITAVDAVRRYGVEARLCHEQLSQLLAFVSTRSDRLKSSDLPIIRRHLNDIVHHVPSQLGQPLPVKSRPEVWLQTLDRVVWLAQHGKPSSEIASWVAAVLPGEPLYATFQNISRLGADLSTSTAPQRARRQRSSFINRILQHRTLIIVIVLITIVVGALLAGFTRQSATQTPSAVTLTSPAVATRLPEPSATSDPAVVACQKILAAEQAQDWQVIIEQSGQLRAHPGEPMTTCGSLPLVQIEAQAYSQLGQAAYISGDYPLAVQHWTSATERDPDTAPSLALLLRCASARADSNISLFQALLTDFGAAEVVAACGFDPADYLPATPVPTATVDLLSAMWEQHLQLVSRCAEPPCPALYQDDASQWHFGTFLQDIEGSLLLDSRYQDDATRQTWGEALQAIEIDFGVYNPQPYSFPAGSEFGIQVTLAANRTVQLVLVAEPPFNASARIAGTDEEALRCNVLTRGPYIMRASDGTLMRHSMMVRWEAAGSFQFFLDGEPVCSEPIQTTSPSQVGLYYSGSGINLDIHEFIVTLAMP